STVYAFFHAVPEIEFAKDNSAEYLVYRCTNCSEKIRQGFKTGDRGSTGNMRDHVTRCWGDDTLAAVNDTTLEKAREAVSKFKKSKQTTLTLVKKYGAHRSHLHETLADPRFFCSVVTVRWAAESARPFVIVRDRCYRWLQKEGRPNHYVPSNETVAQDLKKLYAASKTQLAKELQAYDFLVPVELDCWTSPNHYAFMSIMAKILRTGKDGTEELTSVLLDFVELPCSHSALNMAETLKNTLEGFGIANKVRFKVQ
ncbi:hypothetical protein F5880DRAFT_1494115, partial [Lentinula raphanica]